MAIGIQGIWQKSMKIKRIYNFFIVEVVLWQSLLLYRKDVISSAE